MTASDRDQLPTLQELSSLGSEAVVSQVEITNYRSIEQATLRLGNVTVLVGGNGVGKSNVVDVFRFVAESLTLGLYTAIERRGGIQAVRHRVPGGRRGRTVRVLVTLTLPNGFGASYGFSIESEAGGSYRVAEEECRLWTAGGRCCAAFHVQNGELVDRPFIAVRDHAIEPAEMAEIFIRPVAPGTELLALPLLGVMPGTRAVLESLRTLRAYAVVPDQLREPQDPDEGRVLSSDGRNATSVWRSLTPHRRRELIDLLGHAVPGVEEVRSIRYGKKRGLEFTQRTGEGGIRFEGHQMSDGTLRLFGILLALLQPARATLIAVEEPEVSIHVAALEALVGVVRAESATGQVLLTTHSADLLDFVDVDELRLVRTVNGKTVVADTAEHSKKAIKTDLFSLGELHRAGALRASDENITA